MSARVLAGLLGSLALAGLACAARVTRPELLAEIESGAPPPIVDVRSGSEYRSGHVPGAVHVSFYSLLWHLEELPPADPEGRPTVLYCEHGPRAGMARAQLWLAGVGPVVFMEGHMSAWKRDGLPVESEGPVAREPAAQPEPQDR